MNELQVSSHPDRRLCASLHYLADLADGMTLLRDLLTSITLAALIHLFHLISKSVIAIRRVSRALLLTVSMLKAPEDL